MENPFTKDQTPSPEKNYSYFVEHPEELTLEDLERIEDDGKSSFLNNFHIHVYRKKPGIEEAMQEVDFDFEWFKKLADERHALVNEWMALLNGRQTSTPEGAERLKQTRERALSIGEEMSPKLLELYKAMRRKGYKHYPDLTV